MNERVCAVVGEYKMDPDIAAVGLMFIGGHPLSAVKIEDKWFYAHDALGGEDEYPIDTPDIVLWEREQ